METILNSSSDITVTNRLLTALLLALFVLTAHARSADLFLQRDTVGETVHVFFPLSESLVSPGHSDNAVELQRIVTELERIQADSAVTLLQVSIHSYSSPDGPWHINEPLARERADSLAAYLVRHAALPSRLIVAGSTPEDWKGLSTFIEEATYEQLPHLDALRTIVYDDREPDVKEWLMKTTYPDDYRYLMEHCMPRLRRSECFITYLIDRSAPLVAATTSDLPATAAMHSLDSVAVDTLLTDTVAEPLVATETRTLLWPRMNLLLPCLNIGLELPLGNRWSVAADWYYPWAFRNASHKNCFQALGLNVEGRYWFGRKHSAGEANRRYRLQGHSIGLFAMSGYYDVERHYRGDQGDYVLGGIDYLYAKPLCRGRVHLEFSLGVGYFYSKATQYEVFERGGRAYRDKNFRKIYEYFGPLKAAISLVVPLRVTRKITVAR